MASYPGGLASFAGFTSGHTLEVDNHGAQHNLEQGEILATQTKIGTGSSTPTNNKVLRGNGTGTSIWAQVALTTDVTGVLPVTNGGTGVSASTGTGSVVLNTSPTISGAALTSSPTLTTPVIADFTNATHTHASNAQGGQLTGSAALVNTTVTADKLNLGAQQAFVSTSETTSSLSYTDLASVNDTVTVTIGANGLALVALTSSAANTAASSQSYIGFDVSGATTQAATDNYCLEYITPPSGANFNCIYSSIFLLTGLTPGSTTFKMKYKVNANTGTFANRRIAVIPL